MSSERRRDAALSALVGLDVSWVGWGDTRMLRLERGPQALQARLPEMRRISDWDGDPDEDGTTGTVRIERIGVEEIIATVQRLAKLLRATPPGYLVNLTNY